ncbi:hypothetical protein Pmar_PMAR028773 [Perkinsus marinus ATCC 50983]|uniref:Uncharacterized protein n=1 Tax=Perkinsus marinus (strain ATCC 50983 / TXsc) TaxID=423536 RepID=C5LFR9_PERM5|nr:hypothetical protein Pmar_PMAR028773 [Perkinsus marinus ATCC 50983]EER04424.1 hypothetical protein Pmar_PMAR028773 [Perkinsus marinus ATCC 50983]|eukprot:XP_002772608.1 hypothetical protein Pmar_PMAR028773 [Perkinsus marinus ATCC 50983]
MPAIGKPNEAAVACIGGQSFEMKSLNNSNARLVCQVVEGGRVEVACNQRDTFVLEPIGPKINHNAVASVLEEQKGDVEGIDDRKRLKHALQASDEEVDAFLDDPQSKIVTDNAGRIIVMDENFIVETLDLVSLRVTVRITAYRQILSVLPDCCDAASEEDGGRIHVDVEECWQALDSVCDSEGRSTPPLSVVARLLASLATENTAKSRTNIELDEGRIRVARAAQIVCQRGSLPLKEFEEQFA